MGSGISKSKHSSEKGDGKGKKTIIKVLTGHTGGINCFDIMTDNTTLLTGSDDRTGRVWNLATYECKVVLEGHIGYINCCKIWDDKFALTGSVDKTIRKWNIFSGNCVLKMEQHNGIVNRMVIYGSHLFTTSYDRTIVGWNLFSGHPTRVFRGHKQSVLPIVYYQTAEHDPKGKTDIDKNKDSLITGSMDNTAKLWSIQSGTQLHSFKGHRGAVLCLAVDHNKNILFTGSTDYTIRKWNISDGQLLKTFKGHAGSIICLQISHKLLYSASVDGTARCWVADFGDTTRKYTSHEHMISDMKYHNGFVITGSGDNTVRVFDAKSGALKRTFKGHKYVVNCVMPLHDTIISGSYDGTLRIWNIRDLVMEKYAESEDVSTSSMVSVPSVDMERSQGRTQHRPPSTYSDATITEENEVAKKRRSPRTKQFIYDDRNNVKTIPLTASSIYDVQNAKKKNHQIVPVSVHHNSNVNNNTELDEYDEAAKGLDELLETEEQPSSKTSSSVNSEVSRTEIETFDLESLTSSPIVTSNYSSRNGHRGNERSRSNKKPTSAQRVLAISPSTISSVSTTSTPLTVSLPSGNPSPNNKRVDDMITVLQNNMDKKSTVEQRIDESDVSRKKIKTDAKKEKDLKLVDEEMKMIAMETASNSTGYYSDKSSPQSPQQKTRKDINGNARKNSRGSYNSSFYETKTRIPFLKNSSRQSLLWRNNQELSKSKAL